MVSLIARNSLYLFSLGEPSAAVCKSLQIWTLAAVLTAAILKYSSSYVAQENKNYNAKKKKSNFMIKFKKSLRHYTNINRANINRI